MQHSNVKQLHLLTHTHINTSLSCAVQDHLVLNAYIASSIQEREQTRVAATTGAEAAAALSQKAMQQVPHLPALCMTHVFVDERLLIQLCAAR